MIAKVEGDMAVLAALRPTVVVTGSYLSIPVACRKLGIALVWVVQSTWLPGFFASGAGMTDDLPKLKAQVGVADQRRLAQYFEAVNDLDTQLNAMPTVDSCTAPAAPSGSARNWHQDSKHFMDIALLAMACDLTRVATIQYSNSWGVHYKGYTLGEGREALGDWSDHFLSHKLDDGDRATDLDGLERAESQRIADARVVTTSRFRARRFAYLVEQLKAIQTPTGRLYDETLAMYCSENGDGDSHARTNMPILLAGGLGGFKTGRTVAAPGQPTGALHASILRYYGVDVGMYGDPVGSAIAGLQQSVLASLSSAALG